MAGKRKRKTYVDNDRSQEGKKRSPRKISAHLGKASKPRQQDSDPRNYCYGINAYRREKDTDYSSLDDDFIDNGLQSDESYTSESQESSSNQSSADGSPSLANRRRTKKKRWASPTGSNKSSTDENCDLSNDENLENGRSSDSEPEQGTNENKDSQPSQESDDFPLPSSAKSHRAVKRVIESDDDEDDILAAEAPQTDGDPDDMDDEIILNRGENPTAAEDELESNAEMYGGKMADEKEDETTPMKRTSSRIQEKEEAKSVEKTEKFGFWREKRRNANSTKKQDSKTKRSKLFADNDAPCTSSQISSDEESDETSDEEESEYEEEESLPNLEDFVDGNGKWKEIEKIYEIFASEFKEDWPITDTISIYGRIMISIPADKSTTASHSLSIAIADGSIIEVLFNGGPEKSRPLQYPENFQVGHILRVCGNKVSANQMEARCYWTPPPGVEQASFSLTMHERTLKLDRGFLQQ